MRDHLRFYRHRWFKAWIALIIYSVLTALAASMVWSLSAGADRAPDDAADPRDG